MNVSISITDVTRRFLCIGVYYVNSYMRKSYIEYNSIFKSSDPTLLLYILQSKI